VKQLTRRQRQLLDFIGEFLRQRGYPPSVREMAAAIGARYPNTVTCLVRALEKKGYLRREASGKARAISLGQPAQGATLAVPILGRVAAGLPVLSEENFEGTLQIDRRLVYGRGRFFALRVSGDSMIGRGIFDGDLAVVRATSQARPGDIVVALLDGEATVKELRRTASGLVLQPANPAYPPILLDEKKYSSATILGVVVALARSLPAGR